MRGEDVGRLTRLLLPPLLGWLRRQDLAGAGGPDMFVANSRHVAGRIARYYGRSAEVVHPPIDVDHFLGAASARRRTSTWSSGGWFRTSGSTSRCQRASASAAL